MRKEINEVHWFCDICGKEIKNKVDVIEVYFRMSRSSYFYIHKEIEKRNELCMKCYKKLYKSFDNIFKLKNKSIKDLYYGTEKEEITDTEE